MLFPASSAQHRHRQHAALAAARDNVFQLRLRCYHEEAVSQERLARA